MADPGIVNSNMIHMNRWFDPLADIFFRPFCNNPQKGAIPALNALQSQDTGLYYVGKDKKPVNKSYQSQQTVEWLWQTTEQLLAKRNIHF
jgi:hypothetical protein